MSPPPSAVRRNADREELLAAYDAHVRRGLVPTPAAFLSRLKGDVEGVSPGNRYRRVSRATFYEWLKLRESGELKPIEFQGRTVRSELFGHRKLQAAALAKLRESEHVGPSDVHRALSATFPPGQVPNLRTLQRYVAMLVAAGTIPRRHRSKYA